MEQKRLRKGWLVFVRFQNAAQGFKKSKAVLHITKSKKIYFFTIVLDFKNIQNFFKNYQL